MYKRNLIRVWETDNYRVSIESEMGYAFLHCTVKHWSKSVLKELQGMIGPVLDWVYDQGYDGLHAYTENGKMARLIPGAKKVSEFTRYNSDVHLDVFKWSK